MASKGFRKLIDDDGQGYYFSCDKFNNAIVKYHKKSQAQNVRKVYKDNIYRDISEELSFSFYTVQNWKRGRNGPGSLEDTKNSLNFYRLTTMNYWIRMKNIFNHLQPKNRIENLLKKYSKKVWK